MKEMIKKMREEKDGFTMAELLIVVAIVAVLVAIAIPVFTSQLGRAQAATDQANCRSYYASSAASFMTDNTKLPTAQDAGTTIPTYDGVPAYTLQQGTLTVTVGDEVTFTYDCKDDEFDTTWKFSTKA